MKEFLSVIAAYIFILCFSVSTMEAYESKQATYPDPEDAKWIAKCIEDNKYQGASADVIKKYCECMVSKMADDESQSVTQWEKTHPESRKECDKASGWK